MNATTTPKVLTTEERKMLKDRLMDENYVRIEDDLARAPRKDDPSKTLGSNFGRFVRYLLLHDAMQSNLEDPTKTHKTDAQIKDDLGFGRTALRNVRELGAAEGIVEYGRINRPGDGRRTTEYGVKVVALTDKLNNSEIARAEEKLGALEGNRSKWAHRQREYLEARVATLRETLDLMRRICGEPEPERAERIETEPEGVERDDFEYDVPDLDDIPFCGCGGSDCPECAPYGYERVEDEEPETCFECNVTESHEAWCSLHGFADDPDPEVQSADTDGLECVNQQFNVYAPNTLQQSTSIDNDSLTREFFVNTQNSLGDSSLALVAPREDEEFKEPMSTTSTRYAPDSIDGEGTEEVVSTISTKTTRPMHPREAWPMYDRGEITLEQLTALCKPARGEQEEVA